MVDTPKQAPFTTPHDNAPSAPADRPPAALPSMKPNTSYGGVKPATAFKMPAQKLSPAGFANPGNRPTGRPLSRPRGK